ncbi:hypothetical protein LTR37_001780 [Vermiconidia calcicola]|uniref:Uncharacterized protein n=1 Tax=Vermiconidia calcicola TaxID=1690605 RepID=A0ACC3NV25_9PEZI|nr:hypothetical protein LTR37_001780 [Vermiconidia calcicola]
MPELIGLPLDVKTLIFSYIRRRSDVKTLYETCKDFYDIVIPRIYRSIRLKESVPISTLCAFLNLENRALVHVRHIEIGCRRNEGPRGLRERPSLVGKSAAQRHPSVLQVRASHSQTRTLLTALQHRHDQADQKIYHAGAAPATTQASDPTLRVERTRGWLECAERPQRRSSWSTRTTTSDMPLEIRVDLKAYCNSRKLKPTDELHRATASENIVNTLIGEGDPGVDERRSQSSRTTKEQI